VDGVPWPARPLPPVTHFDDNNDSTNYRVAAVILRDPDFGIDPRYPVGIRIGDLTNYSLLNISFPGFNVYTTNFFNYQPGNVNEIDPTHFLFTRTSHNPEQNGQPLLPIVVYRQQVTNSVFPKVSGSLIQVTPLMERLPWKYFPPFNGIASAGNRTVIFDLLIAATSESVGQGNSISVGYFMYLRDQQPVMVGACYHYFVMRMNEKHEIAEIIDAGTVTIPPN
jgi:hypothetical protein